MFEKMKRVPNYTDDEAEDESSKRYTFLAKNLMDKIEGLRAEIDAREFDPLNIRENLKKIVDMENIRNRGFNTAINSLTSILDTSKMGYQYIENLKNARELIIREYEDTDVTRLPDERYQIRLKYYDSEQLEREREAYDKQMEAFKNEILHAYDVIDAVYARGKGNFKISDFDDLARQVRGTIRKQKEATGEPLYEDIQRTWNEIVRIKAEDTDVERLNQTYLFEKALYKKLLRRASDKVQTIFGFQNPQNRVILDQRIGFLEREFEEFDYLINPYHVQPGLILDIDISSIKRKKFTLNGMANVLNEFLHGVSKGFQDAAFASFKRRRSTVREDIGQSFAGTALEERGRQSHGEETEAQYQVRVGEEPTASEGIKGRANVTPSRKKAQTDDLQEL
jgi:hypothetical protein